MKYDQYIFNMEYRVLNNTILDILYHTNENMIDSQYTCTGVYVTSLFKVDVRDHVDMIIHTISRVFICYYISSSFSCPSGRRSPAVACWASDHWVASSNPLRGKFRH